MGKELLAGLFAWLLFIIPVCIHLRLKQKKEEGEYDALVKRVTERELVGEKVNCILKTCMADLTRQHAMAFGPWIPSLLDGGDNFTIYRDSRGRVRVERQHRNVPPNVALTAVQWTIKELAGRRFDLGALRLAERELLEMGA